MVAKLSFDGLWSHLPNLQVHVQHILLALSSQLILPRFACCSCMPSMDAIPFLAGRQLCKQIMMHALDLQQNCTCFCTADHGPRSPYLITSDVAWYLVKVHLQLEGCICKCTDYFLSSFPAKIAALPSFVFRQLSGNCRKLLSCCKPLLSLQDLQAAASVCCNICQDLH